MKIKELTEKESTKGTFVGAKFSKQTIKDIDEYLKKNKIPNPIKTDKLHTTILYSRKYLPDYKAAGKYGKPYIGMPGDFEIWKGYSDKTGKKTDNCLVLSFTCPGLKKRHEELMDEHDAEHDYPEYKTHFTLSYDIGDFDISNLPKYTGKIEAEEEYQKDLDLT